MDRAPVSSVGVGTAPVRGGRENTEWFREHFEEAATAVIDFLSGDGIELQGLDVADVGSGDGIIDLGVVLRAKPASLTGFDIVETDRDHLLELARRERVADGLPAELDFFRSDVRSLPAADNSFDVIFSWSTFEHVADPAALLRDVRRVLRPGGVLMIQIWPLFHSQHGSHLWQYFPDGFIQLSHSRDEIADLVRTEPGPDPEWAEALISEFRSCNAISLDGLQLALAQAGFAVRKVELLTEAFHVPEELQSFPLSLLGVAGVKLLATIRPQADEEEAEPSS